MIRTFDTILDLDTVSMAEALEDEAANSPEPLTFWFELANLLVYATQPIGYSLQGKTLCSDCGSDGNWDHLTHRSDRQDLLGWQCTRCEKIYWDDGWTEITPAIRKVLDSSSEINIWEGEIKVF